MNYITPPTTGSGLLQGRMESNVLQESSWKPSRLPPHPALKPDELALHDALLRIAHHVDPRASTNMPAEVFIG